MKKYVCNLIYAKQCHMIDPVIYMFTEVNNEYDYYYVLCSPMNKRIPSDRDRTIKTEIVIL